MPDFKTIAIKIIENIGGPSNISEMSHCMTRLRMTIKNDQLIKLSELENINGVMKVVIMGNQYQVVLGGIVDEVFEEATKLIGDKIKVDSEIINENLDKPKTSIFNKLIEIISGIITPIIPAMLAAGFITTAAKLAELAGVSADNTTIQILLQIGDVLYGFFPIIIGWSAAKYFKANISVTLVVVGVLVYPGFTSLFATNEALSFLGIPVTNVYYGSSVLPAIFGAYLISKFETLFRRILPSSLRSIFVPFLSALIVAPLLITVIGPIGVWGGNLFASLFTSAYNLSPILAGAVIGGTWQILIIFGMHIAILGLVSVPNIAAFGRDTVIMTHAPSLICQVAAGLAVALKAKNKEIKRTALTLSLTSFFAGSVVEPVMYGITLKYKKPFIAVCIGGAIGGAISGASFAGTTAAVAFSLYTFPVYLGTGFVGLLLGCLVGAGVTFVLTYMMGIDESI